MTKLDVIANEAWQSPNNKANMHSYEIPKSFLLLNDNIILDLISF
jgi:hypothetical protein